EPSRPDGLEQAVNEQGARTVQRPLDRHAPHARQTLEAIRAERAAHQRQALSEPQLRVNITRPDANHEIPTLTGRSDVPPHAELPHLIRNGLALNLRHTN